MTGLRDMTEADVLAHNARVRARRTGSPTLEKPATGQANAGNKYHAKTRVVDGHRFDSGKEADRYAVLKLLERAGRISNLRIQVKYPIEINGEHITTYTADFVYMEDGREVVEDAKGFRNRLYLIKRKMVRAAYGIEILET